MNYRKKISHTSFSLHLMWGVSVLCHGCKKIRNGTQMKPSSISSMGSIDSSYSTDISEEAFSFASGKLTPSMLYAGDDGKGFIAERGPERLETLKQEGRSYYQNGIKCAVSSDVKQKKGAIGYFEKGASCGNPSCMVQLGNSKKEEGDILQAIQWYVFALQVAFMGGDKKPYELAQSQLNALAEDLNSKEQYRNILRRHKKRHTIEHFIKTIQNRQLFVLYTYSFLSASNEEKTSMLGSILKQYISNQHEPYLSETDNRHKFNWIHSWVCEYHTCSFGKFWLGQVYDQGYLKYNGKIDRLRGLEYYKQSDDPRAKYLLADYAYDTGKYQEAAIYLEEVIHADLKNILHPDVDPDIISKAYYLLGKVYFKRPLPDVHLLSKKDDLRQALRYLEQSAIPSKDFKLALTYYVDENYKKAAGYFKKVANNSTADLFERQGASDLLYEIYEGKLAQVDAEDCMNYFNTAFQGNSSEGRVRRLGLLLGENKDAEVFSLLEEIEKELTNMGKELTNENSVSKAYEREMIWCRHKLELWIAYFCGALRRTGASSMYWKKIESINEETQCILDICTLQTRLGFLAMIAMFEETGEKARKLLDKLKALIPDSRKGLLILEKAYNMRFQERSELEEEAGLLQDSGLPSTSVASTAKAVDSMQLINEVIPSIQFSEPTAWKIEFTSKANKLFQELIQHYPHFEAKVQQLIEDITLYPWAIWGRGRPERLDSPNKNLRFSRRISEEHRLVYELDRSSRTVYITECGGHYINS